MKIYIFIAFLAVFSSSQNFAQMPVSDCTPINTVKMPISPYENGCLYFDGDFDFARSKDIEILEFNYGSTDSFSISVDLKILPHSRQYIIGKYNWVFAYNIITQGWLCFYVSGAGWKNIYYLNNNTNWHNYKIKFNRTSSTLTTYVDGNPASTFNNYSYLILPDCFSFSIGNYALTAGIGPNSVNRYDGYFNGYMDNLSITVNDSLVVLYKFDECAGQVLRDSISFFIHDRTYPEGSYGSDAVHMQLGFGPSPDSCDPKWTILSGSGYTTGFSQVGSGLGYFNPDPGVNYFSESFSLGLTVWNGYLVNTGVFNRINGNTEANYISGWDGNSWYAFGNGFNHEGVFLTTYQNALIAVGYFDSLKGGIPVNYIAKWDGMNWSGFGDGFDGPAYTALQYGQDLLAGGYFTKSGNTLLNRIGRWDGATWQPVGAGFDGTVWTLCVYNNELYAGGGFLSSGNQTCNGIAKWNGSQWMPVGAGITGTQGKVYVLYVYNGLLWAGGNFKTMDNITVNGICYYDGSVWHSAGAGVCGTYSLEETHGEVVDMVSFEGDLYVCGSFTFMDNEICNKLARWNGSVWCPVEYGPDLRPEDLEVYNGEMIMNGDFYSVSGREYSNIVKYQPDTVIGIINIAENLKPSFTLSNNYPNPFNPKTTIKYDVTGKCFIKMLVFDITGREVKTLVNEYKNTGTYYAEFDGSDFSSGVYFYRVESEGIFKVRRMVLLK